MVCAFCLLLSVLYAVAIFHPGALSWLSCPKFNFFLFMMIFLMSLGVWLYSVVIEATFEGNHSFMVQSGISLGFILFVMSEMMFFFSFFWAFFHSSLSPNVEVGCIWPPSGVTPINPFGLPLVNTVMLLVSGASLTCSHNFLLGGKFLSFSMSYMGVTVSLGILFTFIQIFECCDTPINISSFSYGSSFFLF